MFTLTLLIWPTQKTGTNKEHIGATVFNNPGGFGLFRLKPLMLDTIGVEQLNI